MDAMEALRRDVCACRALEPFPRPLVLEVAAELPAEPVVDLAAALAEDTAARRPRMAAPCRCAMRYTDDSAIPNRLLISDTGVSVAA